MRRRNNRNKIIAEMNVVPYIDVMLVLLVIFMVTAPMIKEGIKIDLPNSKSTDISIPDDSDPLIISMSKDNKLYLNRNDEKSSVTIENVIEIFKAEKEFDDNLKVFIRGDKSSNYGDVIELMNMLKNRNVKEVGLVTEDVD